MFARASVFLGLTALGLPLADQATVLEGEHFAIHMHFDAPDIARESLELVEAVWPVAAALFGRADAVPEQKLQIHLYRNAADYVAAEAPLTNGRFARNLAFTNWDTGFAHVALQPDRKDALLEELGLDYQTARLLTHEAAHAVRIDTCPNFRSHPRWFADAVASWVDRTVLEERAWITAPMDDPYMASMGLRMQQSAEAEQLPAFSDVIEGQAAEQTWQGTYALHAQLFPFLATQGKGDVLGSLCAGVRQLGGGEGFGDRLAEVVYAAAKRKPKQLDKAFPKFVGKLEPAWEQIYPSLQATGEDWVQLAFPEKNAIVWRTDGVRKGKLTLAGEVRILPGRARQLNLLLDRRDGGFVQVCFVGGYGVTIFEYLSRKNSWEKRASAEVPFALGEFHAWQLRTRDGQLTLELDGKQVVMLALERDFSGPWGLGAQAGSAGIWRGVRAK